MKTLEQAVEMVLETFDNAQNENHLCRVEHLSHVVEMVTVF
jgi:hypothetical protein